MDGITEKDVKTLQAEMAALREDLAKITGTMRDIARRETRQFVKDAKTAAGDIEGQAREKLENITDAIESKPVASAAASFGVGFLLGLLINSRRS
jgi:ElaB/YqjD/DUF883 family membrane-anchored ribosome-binding protein